MNTIDLVTPTSDRPVAFALCERWVKRALAQYAGDVRWIVADDGRTPVRCSMGQIHIRRPPSESRADSFVDNLLAALERTAAKKVLFIEDDDWYAVDYIAQMSTWLDRASVVGQARAKYYNVVSSQWFVCRNTEHASLCQTGVRGEVVPELLSHLADVRDTSLDVHLWHSHQFSTTRYLEPHSNLAIGIKGMPGAKGLGRGHRMPKGTARDESGNVLRTWMPELDAITYLQFSANTRSPGSSTTHPA